MEDPARKGLSQPFWSAPSAVVKGHEGLEASPDEWFTRFWQHHRLGPLDGLSAEFDQWLAGQEYAWSTRRNLVRAFARVDSWMLDDQLCLGDVTAGDIQKLVARDNAASPAHRSANTNTAAVVRFLSTTHRLRDIDTRAPDGVSQRQACLQQWLDFLRFSRGQGASWIGKARHLGGEFLGLLEDDSGVLDWQRVNARMANEFLARSVRGYSSSTAQTMAALLRGLLDWAASCQWVSEDVSGGVLLARRRRGAPPDSATPGEVEALIAAVDPTSQNGARDLAIITTIARLGLRAGELAGLLLEDIDWPAATMRVTGKGGRVLVVPIPVDVGEAIVDYLRVRHAAPCQRHVFVRVLPPLTAMTRAGIGEVVAKHARAAGLDDVHAHTLRHSLASRVISAGGGLHDVQELLGHASLASSLAYARADVEVLRRLAPAWGTLP